MTSDTVCTPCSHGSDELADPRIVHTDDLVENLADILSEVLIDARDRATTRLRDEFQDAPIAGAGNFDGIARNAINVALSDGRIVSQSQPIVGSAVERTLDRLDSDVHSPRIQTVYGVRYQQQAQQFARTIEFSTRNAADDMLDRMRTGVRHGATRGDRISDIIERVESEFSDSELRNRAKLIAHMELQTAVQSTKLGEYEASDAVDGLSLVNPCNSSTTELCENLAGCGGHSSVEAWFDDDEGIHTQLDSKAPDELKFVGFNPLGIPPFHYGCRTELVPLTKET